MKPYLAFAIAAFGLAAMAWVVYRQRDQWNPLIVIGFGLYSLLFALGVGYYSEGMLTAVKGGPAGLEITLAQAKQEIKETGNKTIENIKAEVARQGETIQQLIVRAKDTEVALAKQQRSAEDVVRQLQPRTLSTKQQEELVAELKSMGPHNVFVVFSIATGEAENFARQIFSVLKRAGWTVPEPVRWEIEIFRPLSIWVKDTSNPPREAVILKNAFGRVGFRPELVQLPDQVYSKCALIVGAKQ